MKPACLHIDKYKMIREVQRNFSGFYPFLRINFFKNRNNGKQITEQSIVYADKVRLSEINPDLSGGEIEISDGTTILEFENILSRRFGLYAQVVRKSGNLWLGTLKTSNWTMKEQNEHGEAISPETSILQPFGKSRMAIEHPNRADYSTYQNY
jgi:hypothetical protein